MNKTEEVIKDVIVDIVNCDREILNTDTTFVDMKADSMDMVQIVVTLEDTLEIEIDDDDVNDIKTFGGFVSYIEGKVTGNKQ